VNGALHLRLAWHSLRRTPGLTAMMVVGLGLGIGTWVTARAALDGATRDPLPEATTLHHVSLVRPPVFADVPDSTVSDGRLERVPRYTLSVRDARALAAVSTAPTRATATFAGRTALRLADGPLLAEALRFSGRDLFSLFDLRFAAGGPWTAADDHAGAPVVVVDEGVAHALGGSALGRTVEVAGTPCRIVGVLEGGAREKLYDHIFFGHQTERVFAPIELARRLGIGPEYGYDAGQPPGPPGDPRANRLGAFVWVDLPDAAHRTAYLADAAAAGYVARVLPFAHFRRAYYVLHPAYLVLNLFAHVVLVASALNLVRLLLAKYSARADLSGIHRALGATQRSIVAVQVAEAALIGVAAGVLGLALGAVAVPILNAIVPDRLADAAIDGQAVLVTAVVAMAVGAVSGLYPAWRVARQPPAIFLRGQ
jgi:putative ABC transport system permease protein